MTHTSCAEPAMSGVGGRSPGDTVPSGRALGHAPVRFGLCLVVGWLCCRNALPAGVPAVSVEPGNTIEQVEEKLGTPQGMFKVGRLTTYYYERGMVDFVDGVVVKTDVVSLEDMLRRRRERERAEKEAARQAEIARSQAISKGSAELEKALSDRDLAAKSPEGRVAFWEAFAKAYPYTDVSKPLAKAKAAVEAAKQDREGQALMATSKKRVGEIETRLKQLDADYAVSLANWKRNEIDAERAKLKDEMQVLVSRMADMMTGGTAATNAP